MNVFSSQWSLQFKQLQINPTKKFRDLTGFEPMASALASLAMKNHTLGAGQFVEFILTHEWNEAMKMMQTGENTNFKCRYDRRSGNCIRQLHINPKKKNQNSTVAIVIFFIVCCEAVARGLDNV